MGDEKTALTSSFQQQAHYGKDFSFCAGISISTSRARFLTRCILGSVTSSTMSTVLTVHTFPTI